MLKELALLVTLLALFADARPQPSKLKDTLIEMSDEVEENSDSLTNSNDIHCATMLGSWRSGCVQERSFNSLLLWMELRVAGSVYSFIQVINEVISVAYQNATTDGDVVEFERSGRRSPLLTSL
ncbi:hypothetical protein EMCRGX_G021338 [Ephydatia muelleri]